MSNPIGTLTLFKRETMRFIKVYTQTLVSPVISNLLYLAIFGLSLNRAIPVAGEFSYLQFLIPGLVMMGIINNAYMNPSSSIIIMRYSNLLDDLMTIPLKSYEILLAFTTSAILRGLIVGGVTLATGLFFVSYSDVNIPIILASSFLVAIFFSFFGVCIGIWSDSFDKNSFVLNFILTPLIFLGGVFYPVSSLPPLFAKLSSYNPIVYMIDLLRFGFIGVNDFPISLSFSVIGIFTILTGGIAYYMLRSGYKLQT